MIDNQNPLACKLKELRIEHGHSKRAMAKKIGVSPHYLNMLEKGEKKASSGFIQSLIQEYNLQEEEHELQILAKISPNVCLIDCSKLTYEERRCIVEKE